MRRVLGPDVSEQTSEKTAEECFATYGRYWAEAFRIPTLSRAELDAGMSWEGMGHVEAGLQHGKGVILGMPHIGGFDGGGPWFAAPGFDTPVFARAPSPPEHFHFFKPLRPGLHP